MESSLNAKICKVCGDKALSFHYNGVACHPCKMFFKRNSQKSNQMHCSKNSVCEINCKTRKSCAKCRLNKCFTIGMTLNAIPNKDNLQQVNSTTHISKLNINHIMVNAIEQTLNILDVSNESHDNEIFIVKQKYPIKLNEYESQLINEITTASSVFVDESQLLVIGEIKNLVEAFNAYSRYVKLIVQYCNRISAFKCMHQDDQLALLKPFYFELLAIRFSFLYDQKTDGYPVIENEQGSQALLMKLAIIDDSKMYHLTEIHRKFKRFLHVKMENDTTIRDLIMAQFLFRPMNGVKCTEFVRNQYFVYCYLLKRYLENKYKNVSIAAKKYTSLMSLLEDFARCHYVREIFSAVDATKVSDVLAEVFDIA